VNRRKFLRATGLTLGAGSLASSWTGKAFAQLGGSTADASFPQNFLWGAATAAYQVEGAVNEGGRGRTIWDTFSHTPGTTFNGNTGDVADDFYHLFPHDVQLMKAMGVKAFRFSVAWSRIFPDGTGEPNQAGIDFYNRLVDSLMTAGIAPFCTLYHWDLPQTLQDRGGWENRDTAKAFADYAGFTSRFLSDRVKHFMTMNEMRSFVELGYGQGIHAPGLRLDARRLAQLTHYVVLAHGLSVQSIRAHSKPGIEVGIADNAQACTPIIETPEHIEAARRAMREQNAMFLTVIQEGRYTNSYLQKLGNNAPKFTADEMDIIKTPLDFVGLNVYQPTYVRADNSVKGYEIVGCPASFPHMDSSWLYVGPEALYWVPRLVHELWKVNALYITENGASSDDQIAPDGQIYDSDRIMYLRNYMTQLRRATAEGVPVKGYFLWSLLDNFEWADGYKKRFGIVYVDFKTQKRIPKLSATYYKDVIQANSVK
jgi:beta-glucosidase